MGWFLGMSELRKNNEREVSSAAVNADNLESLESFIVRFEDGREVTFGELDKRLETNFIEEIKVRLNTTRVVGSEFCFTDNRIFYREWNGKMVPRATKLAIRFMKNYNSGNNAISTQDAVQMMRDDGASAASENEFYTAVGEINKGLSLLVRVGVIKKFLRKNGYGKGYSFDTNGY
ncbi:hypothetical protein IIY68_01805 [Candidatus Saccharibacteria bacterium]|nr:hypothetical protein [Candidatus Saccharibacteria bacterium]